MDSIHNAIQAHDANEVKRILQNDPGQLSLRNLLDESPLHRAVWEGQEKIASLLIDAGADVNDVEPNNGNTPLHYAAQSGCPPTTAALLISKGAEIEKPNNAKESPLFVASMRNADVARVLLGHGAYYDLNSAVLLGDMNRVRVLLKEDPHLHRVIFPSLLLDWALQRGSNQMVELLLAHGVDPNKGRPPLFTAVEMALNDPTGNMELVRLLLDRGADIKQRSDGMSALDLVCKLKSKNARKVRALLKKHGAEE